jgi:hypothetical protein
LTPPVTLSVLLADSAQAVGGKLYILGGRWSVTGPGPSASAIALKIEVPWDETNRRHKLLLPPVRLAALDRRAVGAGLGGRLLDAPPARSTDGVTEASRPTPLSATIGKLPPTSRGRAVGAGGTG